MITGHAQSLHRAALAAADQTGVSEMIKPNRPGFATRCIHAGQSPDPTTGAVMMPIYATSTYVQQSPGVHKGYEYARSQNPTRMAFERCVADLESGTAGFAFASGLAAIATILECLDHGAHIVAPMTIFMAARGGCSRACATGRPASRPSYVDLSDLAAVEKAIRPEHEDDLGRDADQSAAEAGRSDAHCRDRAQAQDHYGRRQHLRQPLYPAADRAWLRYLACIRPRNISTAIPTWSADLPSSATIAELRDQLKFLQNAIGGIQGPFDLSSRCAV